MSDRDRNDTDFDDKTAVPQEPNDDKTVVRQDGGQNSKSDEDPSDSNSGDQTVVRDKQESPEPGSDDATIVRNSREPADGAPADSDDATVVRGAGASNESATILRGAANEHATILRGARDSDDSTVLRSGGGESDETIVREGDDDRTVINHGGDDDATVVGGRGDEDTTYVASAGRSEKSRGNSEAGRLLKNRFVLEEKVGSGGMGDVYKALDLRQQEAQERNPYIAIKILNDDFARHKDAFISLQREATRTRGIPHPNIMGVYDFDREGETVFMSMELLDGKPLDDYLRDHPEGVSIEDSWNIIDGICQGLSRAHGAGIVHSDFKPGNIYYTGDKVAKVFDFGIARAVSSPGDIKADGEKTVFDAGSLGALTPTYASLEMLLGKEPTKSDDVYAVALVAYELFTGRHPYNRTPADKALERGLEPDPVPFLKRRHWRALKKGLALKGEDRYDSIDEFHQDMFSEDAPILTYAAVAAVLVASIGFGAYTYFFGVEEIPKEFTDRDGRLTALKTDLNTSLGQDRRNFSSEDWRNTVRERLFQIRGLDLTLTENWADYYEFGAEGDPEIEDLQNLVLDAYLEEVARVRDNADRVGEEAAELPEDADQLERYEVVRAQAQAELAELERAQKYLEEAKEHFAFDATAIANSESRLDVELRLAQDDLQDALDDIESERQAIAAAAAERRARQEEALRIARRNAAYVALRDGEQMNPQSLREILDCKGNLSDRDLADLNTVLNGPGTIEIEIDGRPQTVEHRGMRNLFPEQFEADRPGIVTALTGCISRRIAVRAPERAREVRAQVMAYLPEAQEISSIVIEDLDPCAKRTLEGRGNRNGSWCSDPLSVGFDGPELVVVPPPPGKAGKFAISRLEIKRSDYNRFCEETGCQPVSGPGTLPVTNISLTQAQAYTEWLSDQTGRDYRLPTPDEWRYAAQTDRQEPIDDNINCTVDARGVRLGDRLLSTLSGRPNRWGLYNFVGNAREWAIGDESVLAMGGAHTDPKSECTLDKQVAHPGEADPVTGFRIVRSVEG